jgi:hypothetical protein
VNSYVLPRALYTYKSFGLLFPLAIARGSVLFRGTALSWFTPLSKSFPPLAEMLSRHLGYPVHIAPNAQKMLDTHHHHYFIIHAKSIGGKRRDQKQIGPSPEFDMPDRIILVVTAQGPFILVPKQFYSSIFSACHRQSDDDRPSPAAGHTGKDWLPQSFRHVRLQAVLSTVSPSALLV